MADALILGGGLAGSAAACLLARAGQDVRLLERETAPHHKVCGEFLSVEAVAHLRELGIDPLALGAAPIDRIRLVWGSREVDAPLPFTALGLSRYALDEVLIEQAGANGAQIERGVRVVELDGRTARTTKGDREGRNVLLATGKLPIREQGQVADRRASDGFVGFKMHYKLAPNAARRLAGEIVLVLFKGGYAGLQMVEGNRANLCLVLRRQVFSQLGGDWNALRDWFDNSAFLRRMLADAEPLFERPVAIANLTYALPTGNRRSGPAFTLGDRWAMTPPFSGDGMAIALRSAFLAARCILSGDDAQTYHSRLEAEARRQISRALRLQNGLESAPVCFAAYWLARLHPALMTRAALATRLPEWRAVDGNAKRMAAQGD